MKNSLSTLIGSSVVAAGITLAASGFSPASAITLTGTGTEFTGDNAQADVKVEDIAGGVKFTLTLNQTVNPGSTGSLSAFWTDINPDNQAFLNSLTISGADIIAGSIQKVTNGVNNIGGGDNLNGGGTPAPLDIGFRFNDGGGTEIKTTMFTITGTGVTTANFLTPGLEFGVRVKSIDSGAGSSKLKGTYGEAIPEPLTMLGVGTAIGFGTVFKRRLAKANKKA